jgi:hypothetical protein
MEINGVHVVIIIRITKDSSECLSNVFILLYLFVRVMIMSKQSDLEVSICQLPSCVCRTQELLYLLLYAVRCQLQWNVRRLVNALEFQLLWNSREIILRFVPDETFLSAMATDRSRVMLNWYRLLFSLSPTRYYSLIMYKRPSLSFFFMCKISLSTLIKAVLFGQLSGHPR